MKKMKLASLIVAAIVLVGNARADHAQDARVRAARAKMLMEIELAAVPQPAPSLMVYAEGVKLAIEKREVLITYPVSVTPPACPDGAVCAKSDLVAGVPLIVVSYPTANGALIVSDSLPATATEKEIVAAFKAAVAKAKGESVPSVPTSPVSPVPPKPTKPSHANDSLDEWLIDVQLYDLNAASMIGQCPGGRCAATVNATPSGQPGFVNAPATVPATYPLPMARATTAFNPAVAPRLFTGERFHRMRSFFSRRLF